MGWLYKKAKFQWIFLRVFNFLCLQMKLGDWPLTWKELKNVATLFGSRFRQGEYLFNGVVTFSQKKRNIVCTFHLGLWKVSSSWPKNSVKVWPRHARAMNIAQMALRLCSDKATARLSQKKKGLKPKNLQLYKSFMDWPFWSPKINFQALRETAWRFWPDGIFLKIKELHVV